MRGNHRPKRQPTGDYDVGFARAPERTRFKKGQSGNPKGRPKRAGNSDNLIELLRQVIGETIEVREGEKARRMSMMEAMIRVLAQKAVKGDQKALTTLLTLMREANMMKDPEEQKRYGLIAVPMRPASTEDWLRQVREIEEDQRRKREAREKEEREAGCKEAP